MLILSVNDWQNPPYLIYQICSSHELIRWCLNHGAHVAYPDVELHTPLLNHVAQSKSGTLRSFELLLDHGAKLGRRTLHLAAMKAAAAASEDLEGKMEIVRFLVEEMSCDVNAMDVLEGEKYPHHWGTPLNYVVRASGYSNVGQESVEIVARYLLEVSFSTNFVLDDFVETLELLWWVMICLVADIDDPEQQGANPYIKDCSGFWDAFELAKSENNSGLYWILDEWEPKEE